MAGKKNPGSKREPWGKQPHVYKVTNADGSNHIELDLDPGARG